ncbi:17632_t:CDS:2, partial [Gigaspora rosea]
MKEYSSDTSKTTEGKEKDELDAFFAIFLVDSLLLLFGINIDIIDTI